MKKVNLFLVYTPGCGDFIFLQQMDILSKRLKDHPKIHFMKYPKPETEDALSVYKAIKQNILECGLFVAVATYGSSGLGAEVAIANSCKKQTLVFFDSNSKQGKSKVLIGNCSENENAQILEYYSGADLFDRIIDQVESMLV